MKVYVQTDIEGIAGFCFRENRANTGVEGVQHRYRMYKLLTNEVNAAVRAAFDEGAEEATADPGGRQLREEWLADRTVEMRLK